MKLWVVNKIRWVDKWFCSLVYCLVYSYFLVTACPLFLSTFLKVNSPVSPSALLPTFLLIYLLKYLPSWGCTQWWNVAVLSLQNIMLCYRLNYNKACETEIFICYNLLVRILAWRKYCAWWWMFVSSVISVQLKKRWFVWLESTYKEHYQMQWLIISSNLHRLL